MKQKQIRLWCALGVAVVAGIVVTGLFLERPSGPEVNHPRTVSGKAHVGEGLQPDAPASGDAVSVSPLPARPTPTASTQDGFTDATPSQGDLFAPFHGRLSRYQQETDTASRAASEAEGEALAR